MSVCSARVATAQIFGLGYRLKIGGEDAGVYPDQVQTEAAARKHGCHVRYVRDRDCATETYCLGCGLQLRNDTQRRCGDCYEKHRAGSLCVKSGTFAEKLSKIMLADYRWWTKRELAARAGISAEQVAGYFSNVRRNRRKTGYTVQVEAVDPDGGPTALRRYRLVRDDTEGR